MMGAFPIFGMEQIPLQRRATLSNTAVVGGRPSCLMLRCKERKSGKKERKSSEPRPGPIILAQTAAGSHGLFAGALSVSFRNARSKCQAPAADEHMRMETPHY